MEEQELGRDAPHFPDLFPLKSFFMYHTYKRPAFLNLLHICISAAMKEITNMIDAVLVPS